MSGVLPENLRLLLITMPNLILALLTLCLFPLAGVAQHQASVTEQKPAVVWDHGAIIRGDVSRKQIALIFTGGDFGEGTAHILDSLHRQGVEAAFFVTGGYLRNPEHQQLIRRALREGHYVGPHSDQHPLYCPWDDRDKSLLTQQQFTLDLQKNIDDLKALGVHFEKPIFFIPPYEWYNSDQALWARQMGVQMFNFSPGSGSNRDYLPESDPRFVSSQAILDGILNYEEKSSNGLNGYILLLHLGADRKDKMFLLLDSLITQLHDRGYQFVRVDRMLDEAVSGAAKLQPAR